MGTEKPSWQVYFKPRALLVALIFGMLGLATLWANMRVPILPDHNVAADVREIFVVLGAALTGPIGGALAGGISALYSPAQNPALHFSTWIAHVLSGLALGWVYQAVYKWAGWKLVAGWALSVLIYYFALLTAILAAFHLLAPDFLASLAGPGAPPWQGDLIMTIAAVPEALIVFAFTTIVLFALPRRYRRPVWKMTNQGVDKSTAL
jgi:hypothetical protein